ncbi:class C sortase [Brevibacterium sp. HMSC08F02]|uniref:class C sortase n=1 Tax=Brevibacterium sp. HMSC08F02 TaxID=1581140 RepID=UPI000B1F8C73|nr:class C sortase [Brevibacterium sp. HMSC08F02]
MEQHSRESDQAYTGDAGHDDEHTPVAPSNRDKPAKKKRKGINGNVLIAFVLVVVGLGVLLYPVAATQWNNFQQRRAADEYSQLEKKAPPEALNTAWEDAHAYNADLGQISVQDAWTTSDDEDSPEYKRYEEYLSVLSETDALGRVVIPSINSDLPIYHGTSEKALTRGAGHLYGTDFPVGGKGKGEGRHSALSAHTGLQDATMWDNLEKVQKGDAFYIAVSGKKLKYEVDDIQVVEPSDTSSIRREEGKDLVTLITCTPYGINTHRLLVTGHRVPMDPSDDSVFDGSGMQWQWWMWAILVAAAVIVLMLIYWWRKSTKAAKD